MTCVFCGGETPPSHNYCSWKCSVDESIAAGGKTIAPSGLPIHCIRADHTMMEHEAADHPTYLFPVVVDCPDAGEDYRTETHALIYSDGCVAVTLYEYCYSMFSVRDGECLGGFARKTSRLSESARAAIEARRPA